MTGQVTEAIEAKLRREAVIARLKSALPYAALAGLSYFLGSEAKSNETDWLAAYRRAKRSSGIEVP